MCVSHLAEECGLELSSGVAGVKKFTECHLQKKRKVDKCVKCNVMVTSPITVTSLITFRSSVTKYREASLLTDD